MLSILAPLALLLVAPSAPSETLPSPVFAQDGAPPPSPVHAVRVHESEVVGRQRVTGSLRPALDARVTARETGAIQGEVPRVGTVVAQGDVLLRLDDRRLLADSERVRASLGEARAARTRADAEREDARRDFEALTNANEGGAVSAREVRVARARFDIAEADLAAAAARIAILDADQALLELRIDDAVVRAPFAGIVVERLAETGEWVTPGAEVLRLVATDELEVWLDVPERLMTGVVAGGEDLFVHVRATNARVPVVAPRVLPIVDPSSRTFPVVGRVDASSSDLAAGMSVSAELPTGERATWLLVPKDALVYRADGTQVYVVKGKDEGGDRLVGAPVATPVEIAFELDRMVALRPGPVAPNDVVIIEGNERIRPGMTVSAEIRAGEPETVGPDAPVEPADGAPDSETPDFETPDPETPQPEATEPKAGKPGNAPR